MKQYHVGAFFVSDNNQEAQLPVHIDSKYLQNLTKRRKNYLWKKVHESES